MSKREQESDGTQIATHDAVQDQDGSSQSAAIAKEMEINSSLEGLQTEEQRRVLDTVAQVRKCGLESILSLPQLVVCGDQSSGKSSVLEALTEIPFPRNDNLCTRFATEIILRRATTNSLTIKVIPDTKRPTTEQALIKAFEESITELSELPRIMGKAMAVMGLDAALAAETILKRRAFAKDVLSIEIEGPSRPQLTLVDIPGLIQTETKGVTKTDVDLVTEITDHYISQPRTICLAVVSATNDYANQVILKKVREVDLEGERTIGIITKPDRLPSGSGSETAYVDLASNKDIFLKLGWHVLKNRSFEEGDTSFEERNASEANYFRKSNFKELPEECVGIDSLRIRLSALLFEHVKRELPKLREDLEKALSETKEQLAKMGDRRTTMSDCRSYLVQLSLDYYEICKSAVNGHFEGAYFTSEVDPTFTISSPATVRRIRAVVQYMNTEFSNKLRITGHKYHINMTDQVEPSGIVPSGHEYPDRRQITSDQSPFSPIKTSRRDALKWIGQVLTRTRGKELVGNFNPLLIGELFWEQCSKWRQIATDHVEEVAEVCSRFLQVLLKDKCPADIRARLWSSQIQDGLIARNIAAFQELDKIMEDIQNYPINYNHYYTDTINKQRQARQKKSLAECIQWAATHKKDYSNNTTTSFDVNRVVESYSGSIDPNMEKLSCEEALDCLLSIYKVCLELTFDSCPGIMLTSSLSRSPRRRLSQTSPPRWSNGISSVALKKSFRP